MKKLVIGCWCMIAINHISAQSPSFDSEIDSAAIASFLDSMAVFYDSVEATIKYEKGTIEILGGAGTLNVPQGFKYIGSAQTRYIMSELYGNPDDPSMVGILMPESIGVTYGEGYMFVLYYKEIGYVKDGDADKINYDDLMDRMKLDATEENKQRIASGLETYRIVGWAKRPVYDGTKKVITWAKELKFDSDMEANTLNYSILILGRKGVLTLNAIATMNELKMVESEKDQIINMFTFNEGFRYDNYVDGTDAVAEWSIGSLVAGKIEGPKYIFGNITQKTAWIILGAAAWAVIGVFSFRYAKRKKAELKAKEQQSS